MSTQLLNRVVSNLSKFGTAEMQTQILMTAAFEAQKAQLKATSFKHAVAALQSQGKDSIAPQRRKVLEKIIRGASKDDKTGKGEPDIEDNDCLHCGFGFEKYKLTCPSCQQTSKMCMGCGERVGKRDAVLVQNNGLVVKENILEETGKDVKEFLPV